MVATGSVVSSPFVTKLESYFRNLTRAKRTIFIKENILLHHIPEKSRIFL